MKYDTPSGLCTPEITGSFMDPDSFLSWQPSTWPEAPTSYDVNFSYILEKIIKETVLDEIGNVISDAQKVNGSLEHRGHVVALALLCAVDSLAAYAFVDIVGKNSTCKRYKKFVSTYFPPEYQPFAKSIYNLYRNSSVHSWNLFQVSIYPGNDPIEANGGSLSFGLINFFDALTKSVANFLDDLQKNTTLQTNTLKRYSKLKASAVF